MMGTKAPVPTPQDVGGVMSLLAVLGDPKAAEERLNAIQAASNEAVAAEEHAAEQLAKLAVVTADIERREAAVKEGEAKNDAEAAALQVKSEAMVRRQRALEQQEAEVNRLAADTSATLAAREATLKDGERRVSEKEAQLGLWSEKREKEIGDRERAADAKMKEADELRVRYETKLAELRKVAG